MSARLHVGLPAALGDLQKYAKRFDLTELRPVDAATPKPATLRGWRRSVPPSFVFSVVLPRAVGDLAPGPTLDEALTRALEVATAVEARCVVLPTPASVRPTSTNKKRLATVLERIPREGVVLAWEPAGLWEREEIVETARELGVVAVLDAAREAPAPGAVVYTRLRALGKGSAVGQATIDRVADRLRGRREAYVVVEGANEATRVRSALELSMATAKKRPGAGRVVRPAASGVLLAEDEEQ